MEALTCNMCGGQILLSDDQTSGTCSSCGVRVTLPILNRKQLVASMNRANEFRACGDFDTALSIYEQIVGEDETDAEAHWCCALCRFGIEYVQDPATLEYLPTCHRLSNDSFLEDPDYKAALDNCKGLALFHYQVEGSRIAAIQRDILPISHSEKPFDIFLCCKELDENGHRSEDSVLAQDIYYRLTDCGLRVFFARMTLKEVPGEKYEPYIFSALNSARVMLVIATKREHLTAPWVKNEWGRYLKLAQHAPQKRIIPCYKGMSPGEMPEQLASLQSYDMEPISFLQDLLYGIKKLFPEKTAAPIQAAPFQPFAPQPYPIQFTAPTVNTDNLLMRVRFFLEDRDWANAQRYCEKVLDADPQCADAYFYSIIAAHFLNPDQIPTLARWLDRLSPGLTQAESEDVAKEHALFFWDLYQEAQLPKRLDALLDLYPLLATRQLPAAEQKDISLLNESIRKNDLEAARLLLRHKTDPNEAYRRWSRGDTTFTCSPLSETIQAGDTPELVDLLLEYGADPALTDMISVDEAEPVPQNVYLQAVTFRRPESLRALLAWRENQSSQEDTPPPAEPLRFLLRRAVELGYAEMARVLLEHHAEPDLTLRKEGGDTYSLLSDTIRSQFSTELVPLLLEFHADPNICDTVGETSVPALHTAILLQKPELAALLLEHGASWDTPYSEGRKSVSLGRYPYHMEPGFTAEYLTQLEGMGWKRSTYSRFTLSSLMRKKVHRLVDLINE